MCTKRIVCLANSYKNGGRCLAGIEVEMIGNNVSVVTNNGNPRWIRPVGSDSSVGIPECEVGYFRPMDILEVDMISSNPTGAHNENILYRSIKKVSNLSKTNNNLSHLCDRTHSLIFGNRGKAVPCDKFDDIGYSLMMIKPENPRFYITENYTGKQQSRVAFSYKGNNYDLVITDVDFLNNPLEGSFNTGEFYLTLSLGVCCDGWHFKLVSGVIRI